MNHPNTLLPQIEEALSLEDKTRALHTVSALLQNKIAHYTWVGFYFMNAEKQILHLGPYTGLPTEHTEIAYGKGICGQVAESGKTYISDDVYAEANYIACSIDVLAEIVLPIFDTTGNLLAQLDIDSNKKAAFGKEDEAFLATVCEKIGTAIEGKLDFTNFVRS